MKKEMNAPNLIFAHDGQRTAMCGNCCVRRIRERCWSATCRKSEKRSNP
jgi:hypothetical protein